MFLLEIYYSSPGTLTPLLMQQVFLGCGLAARGLRVRYDPRQANIQPLWPLVFVLWERSGAICENGFAYCTTAHASAAACD